MNKLFKWISITAIVCTSTWFIFDHWTAANLEKECRDWPLLNRNLDELSQVYPVTTGSQSTKDLQALYKKISLSDSQDDTNTRQLLKDYLRKEIESSVATIGLLPPDVKKALLANQEIIEQITNLLVTEDILILPLNVDISPVEPIPNNALWLRPINELLIASALSSQLDGKMYKSWRFLEASARLNDALFLQPSLISQVLATVESRNVLVAMRKLTVPAPDWAQHWPNHDFAYGMLMAYTAEAYFRVNMAEKTTLASLMACDDEFRQDYGLERVETGIATKVIYMFAGRQLLRLFASEWIASMRHVIEQRSLEGLCVSMPSQLDVIEESSFAWYPGKKLLSTLYSTGSALFDQYWKHPYLLAVYKEGTQVILRAKTIKAEDTENRWPRVPAVFADSCRAHSWSYQHKPDGSVIFSYDKPLPEGTSPSRVKPGYLKYIGSADE